MKKCFEKVLRSKFSLLIICCTVFDFSCSNIYRTKPETIPAQKIQAIRLAQVIYARKHRERFAPDFNELAKEGILDDLFTGEKPIVNGYIFEMRVTEPTNLIPAFYSINVDPQLTNDANTKRIRHYYFDSTLETIKFTEENRQANANDASF